VARRSSGAVKYLTEEELRSLFAVIKNPRDRCIFMLAFWRGMRASEVGLLRLESYRPKTGRLHVRRLKGSISQDYRLTQDEEKALRAWLRVRGKVPGLLFPGYKRKGIGRRMLDVLIKHYGRLADVPEEKRHFHVLKHSIGTLLGSRGEVPQLIQDHLGHASIQSTMIYLHVTPRQRDEMAERLSEQSIL
jgi:type 1 fimbriae regulatory protein FimB